MRAGVVEVSSPSHRCVILRALFLPKPIGRYASVYRPEAPPAERPNLITHPMKGVSRMPTTIRLGVDLGQYAP